MALSAILEGTIVERALIAENMIRILNILRMNIALALQENRRQDNTYRPFSYFMVSFMLLTCLSTISLSSRKSQSLWMSNSKSQISDISLSSASVTFSR